MSKTTINVGIQGDLFKMGNEGQDSLREFLLTVLKACEQISSPKVIREVFEEWEASKEIEKEWEKEGSMELEEQNDF